MSQTDLMIYAIAALAFVAIVGIGLVFTGDNSQGAAKKRAKMVGQGQKGVQARKAKDENNMRRKETQRMLSKLREDDAKRKRSIVPNDIKTKLEQAGLGMSASAYWLSLIHI